MVAFTIFSAISLFGCTLALPAPHPIDCIPPIPPCQPDCIPPIPPCPPDCIPPIIPCPSDCIPPIIPCPPDCIPPISPYPPDCIPPISPCPPDCFPPIPPCVPDCIPPITPYPPDCIPPIPPCLPDCIPPISPCPPDCIPPISPCLPDCIPPIQPCLPDCIPPISPCPRDCIPPISPCPRDCIPPIPPYLPDCIPPISPCPPGYIPPIPPCLPDCIPPVPPCQPSCIPPIPPCQRSCIPPVPPYQPGCIPPIPPYPPGCIPPITPCSSGCFTPNTPYSFFSSIYGPSNSYSYFNVDTCMAVGIDSIPPYIPTILYDDIEMMMMRAKCDWLSQFSTYYPPNIGPEIYDWTLDRLTYDFVLLYSGPGSLSSLGFLIEQGFRVCLIEEGLYPPAISNSMYYRNAMLNSPFVKPYQTYIPGCNIPKNIYVPRVLGGESLLDLNSWDCGIMELYNNLQQFNNLFSWENAQSRFQRLGRCEKTTIEKETNVEVAPCGCISISTSCKETTVTRTLSSSFSEIGIGGGFSPLTIDHKPGLCTVPYLASGNTPLLYPQQIFSKFPNFDQIDMILGLDIMRLIYEYGRITGVEVMTPFGPKVIYSRYDVILGSSSPISIYELLMRSGIGNPLTLSRLGLPCICELPYLGQQLMANPIYCSSFMRFPQGSLIDEYVSDYTSLDFMFGGGGLSSISSLNYFSAFLNVRGSLTSNIMVRFYAFNNLMLRRLQLTMLYYFQLDIEIVNYFMDMCQYYDILLIAPQLLTPKSCGYLDYGDTIEDLQINLGMYSNEEDILAMIEAMQIIGQLGTTSPFTSIGGELMQFPYSPINAGFFTEEYIRATLPTFSIPNLHLMGGSIMGSDISNSVVNNQFYFHNIPNLSCLGSGITPFPIGADSIAFSSLIGYYGFEFIMDRYNNGFYETFSNYPYMSTNGLYGINGGNTNTGILESELIERELMESNMIPNGIIGSGISTINTIGGSGSSSSGYYMNGSEMSRMNIMGGSGGGGMLTGYEMSEAEVSSTTIESTAMGYGGMQSMSQITSETSTTYESNNMLIDCDCMC